MAAPQIKYDRKLLGKLKSNYFNAKALYECIKEQAEEIQRKVLAENEFYETEDVAEMMGKRGGSGKPERILDPEHTYMMDLETELPRFIDLCYPEYVKVGIADKRGKIIFLKPNQKICTMKQKSNLYSMRLILFQTSLEKRKH